MRRWARPLSRASGRGRWMGFGDYFAMSFSSFSARTLTLL